MQSFSDQLVNACTASAQQRDLVRSFLGEAWNPGGPDLTKRLGEALRLEEWTRVLDVGAGAGSDAVLLTQAFRCKVVGLVEHEGQVGEARRHAFDKKVFDRVTFRQGEADDLKEPSGSFDAVISQGFFSSSPKKAAVARAMHRLLRPGGCLGITDVVLNGPLASHLSALTASAASMGLAPSTEGYQELFQQCGFKDINVTDCSQALRDLVKKLETRVMMARLAAANNLFQVKGPELKPAQALLSALEKDIGNGNLGYVMLLATA